MHDETEGFEHQRDEDALLPFQLEQSVVRGRVVRLGPLLDDMLGRHAYPVPVATFLAQTCAMTAALASALKFKGVFTLQTQTDGPVSRLVVDVTSEGDIRACATFDEAEVMSAKAGGLLGSGHLVFTVDQQATDERYQGVVPIENDDLTAAFHTYFKQSEQIPTGILTFARKDRDEHWHAGCLMAQRMPREGGEGEPASVPQDDTVQEDDWKRVMLLMQTCTADELLDPALSFEGLLFRLFHEEGVRAYDRRNLRHECRCSREKVRDLLASMPKDEIAAMIDEHGKIAVTCHFCSRTYTFEPDAICPAN
ncbi:MAG: molecular chaperone Hsp33 [Proteobacteria bacterium]|nr:molecular chaperone Hsp33 [Pseudomonadota bacterium]